MFFPGSCAMISKEYLRRRERSQKKGSFRHTKATVVRMEENKSRPQEESMEDFASLLETSFKQIHNGEVVRGKILSIAEEWVMVDIGSYMDGVVTREELLYEGESIEDFTLEEELTLQVLKVDTREGQVYLSRKEADKIVVWDELEALRTAETPVELKVLKAVKGGLRVSYKGQAQGFIPASQAAGHYTEDLTPMEGQSLICQILEVRKEKKDFTASHRRILEQEKKEAKDRVFATVKAGTRLTGKVVRLADFGAFVEIEPGVDGLIPIRDLSWSRIKHPSELLKVGDLVQVTVQEVDTQRERISLRLKDINADPWETLSLRAGEYKEGCRVNHVIPGGAFVTVTEGVEGFLPISQICEKRLRSAEDVLSEGQEITVQIRKIDMENRKISLSMREVSLEPEETGERHYSEDAEATTALGQLLGELDI